MMYSLVILDDTGNITETISLDAVLSFSESYESSVAQAAVEDGYSVSDHIVKGNDKFSLAGVVSDSLFHRRGAEIHYVNGEFVRLYSDVDPIDDEQPSVAMKNRLKALRDNREIFGLFETVNVNGNSQVNLIYPCALTKVSFDNTDGAEAIMPNLSFEKIRVSTVEFKTIANPTPELIPYVKHGNIGNQTGDAGAAALDKVDDTDLIKTSKDDASKLLPKETKENAWSNKKVAELTKEEDRLRYANAAEAKFRTYVQQGKFGWTDKGRYVNEYVNIEMTKKYGAGWTK